MKKWFLPPFHQLQAWLRDWLIPPYKTCFIEEDLPKSLHHKTIYLVYEEKFLWHASMPCPCKCGEILHMNLIPDERPCWQVTIHQDHTVSLFPSVWRQKGCRSHFWFQRGYVIWCDKYPLITNPILRFLIAGR